MHKTVHPHPITLPQPPISGCALHTEQRGGITAEQSHLQQCKGVVMSHIVFSGCAGCRLLKNLAQTMELLCDRQNQCHCPITVSDFLMKFRFAFTISSASSGALSNHIRSIIPPRCSLLFKCFESLFNHHIYEMWPTRVWTDQSALSKNINWRNLSVGWDVPSFTC